MHSSIQLYNKPSKINQWEKMVKDVLPCIVVSWKTCNQEEEPMPSNKEQKAEYTMH